MIALFHWITAQITIYLMAWPLLWYCLMVTSDWRARKYFAEGTLHLTEEELRKAYLKNFAIVQDYVQVWPKPRGSLRPARMALIMATVLRHHMLRHEGLFELPGYLRLRREILRQAKRMPRRTVPPQAPHPPTD